MRNFAQKAMRRDWLADKRTLAGLVLLCVVPVGFVASAQEADPALMEEGMRIYKTKAGCDVCHGWRGQGGTPREDLENEPNPVSLVRSGIDRNTMIELVSCGTPGGYMPRYLAAAWTEAHPCYGKLANDLPPESLPPAPYTVLQPSQIDAVVSYVQEVYQGKGMTLDYCEKYFSPNSRACNHFR